MRAVTDVPISDWDLVLTGLGGREDAKLRLDPDPVSEDGILDIPCPSGKVLYFPTESKLEEYPCKLNLAL